MDTLTLGVLNDSLIPLVVITVGGFLVLSSIVPGMAGRIVRTKQHERTKRELAAYVAEGSMTPEQAERLIEAGNEEARQARGPRRATCTGKVYRWTR